MANQVTLTFAGKEQPLVQSMDRVGGASDVMAVRITDAANSSGEKLDYLSSQSSLLSGGIGDIGGAITTAFGEDTAIGQFGAKMEEASAVVTGFTGVMDLGVFATNNFKVASAASAVQTGITSAATKVWAGVQWLLNTALLASPITWIVVGIVALIAVIVLIAKRTDWFSRAWGAAWKWIKTAASNTWDYLKRIPGWLSSAFSRVADFISRPFKSAFNLIARAWNNTVGRLSFTFPAWIPGIGGNGFSVPNLPTFHSGGTVPGVKGTPTVALLRAGEVVNTGSEGAGGEQWVRLDMGELGEALIGPIAKAMGRKGGRPEALGILVR
jgi:hypothetical protein